MNEARPGQRISWLPVAIVIFGVVGIIFVILSWVVGGPNVFWPSFFIEVGVALFLFGFLFYVEQRLEGQVVRSVGVIQESVDSEIGALRTKVGSVQQNVDVFRETIEALKQTLGEEYEDKVTASDTTRAQPIAMARDEPTFENIKAMLMAAKTAKWIHGSGVRVALPREHRLYVRFVPTESNHLYITVRFEEPSQHAIAVWRWKQQTDTASFFAEALRRLEGLHRGSFPRDDFDPSKVMARLIQTIQTGYESATQQPNVTPGITEVVEMPNEDFVVTMRELRCLYNDYRADSTELRNDEISGDYRWRSEDNFLEAWRAARELLAP